MPPRPPFSGLQRKLILGFDVGTTFAGISYCLLEPGESPVIAPVTRFPAQPLVGGDSKVPSEILYDNEGVAQAFGAEVTSIHGKMQAQREGWQIAKWFKLHMRPDSITMQRPDMELHPLPTDKSATAVFSDFLRFLHKCAKEYISQLPAGAAVWNAVEDTIEFVLTHPNGWSGSQQSKLRQAAIMAGLVPGTQSGRKRIHFVTEGEASLHFCIMNGLASDVLNAGKGVIIVDAGGGTVDISAYHKTSNADDEALSFGEIARAECTSFWFRLISVGRCAGLMDGSVIVGRNAQRYLDAALKNSDFCDQAGEIADEFDKTAKLTFRSTLEYSYIKFGGLRDNDEAFDITNGQIKIAGPIVASFFRPSIESIVRAVRRQRVSSSVPITDVFLVGGFAASEWLFDELKRQLGAMGLAVSRPDSHVNKAVSDGAVSFYLDHFVSARVSKATYGTDCSTTYDAANPEHRARSKTVYTSLSGDRSVPKSFSSILRKDVKVEEETKFRASFVQRRRSALQLGNVACKILEYRGMDVSPRWIDVDSGKYSTLCIVHADTSEMSEKLIPVHGPLGSYYRLVFDVVLSFGLTELKAQLAWMENGEEKRSTAEVLYV